MKPIKILILSEKPLEDHSVWSGTMFSMNKAFLSNGYETEWLPLPTYTEKEKKRFEKIERLYQKIFNRGFNKMQFYTKSQVAAKHLKKEIKNKDFDILFAPIAAGEVALLNIKQPIIYLNDATIEQLFNYNILFTGFGYLSKKITKFLEQKTMQKAAANIFSNKWAADNAINSYHIAPEKVHVIRFGANMIVPEVLENKEPNKTLRLLFLAGRWELKGGDIAYDAYRILKEKGYDVSFTIVGCTPDIKDDSVKIIPFIDKNTTEGEAQLGQILKQNDILFLPTRNDCSPIVMCEAAGYGLAGISTKTGGVPEIIIENETGYTLPLSANGANFAEKIEHLIQNPAELGRLSKNARKRYEEVLNWDTWGKEMDVVIKKTLQ